MPLDFGNMKVHIGLESASRAAAITTDAMTVELLGKRRSDMTTSEERIAALKNLLAFAKEDSNPDLHPWELAALEWAFEQLTRSSVGLWRQGNKVGLNVYAGDRPVCQCHDVDDAELIVWAVNKLGEQLSPQGVTISGNVSSSSNSFAVKKEGGHGHASTERNQDRPD